MSCKPHSEYRICPTCGNEFYADHDMNGKKGGAIIRLQKYCSKKCWSNRNPPKTLTCEYCGNIQLTYQRDKKYCSKDCADKARIGTTTSEEVKEKMSISHRGIIPVNIYKSGPEHPFWVPNREEIRDQDKPEYKEWRKSVFKRDNYTCQECGIRPSKGNRTILHAHHIISFSACKETRFKVSNGQTLCKTCHEKTDSFLNRWGIQTRQKVNGVNT